MRSLILTLALMLPASAHAEKERRFRILRPAPTEEVVVSGATEVPAEIAAEQVAEQPAFEPGAGSLWDYVEQVEGSVPDLTAVEESEELDQERTAEDAFLGHSPATKAATQPTQGLDFYRDPVEATGADPLFLAMVDPSEFDIPIVINDDVVRWMEYFTGRGRKYYTRWLARSTRYRPMMYEKLDAAGMPRDLVYLSMIESGYATHAYSRAAAVGLWQFITPTAREWGMRVDWWVDDRRDPEMATDAAVAFLGHLHKRWGDWYLAWAAYNGGPSRVNRAVKRHGTKDFWTLVEKDAFPAETDNYVPKLIAAAIIGHHPERYGFTGIEYQDRMAYDTVEVGPSIGIDVLAKCAGIPVEEFQKLNPHLRRFAVPPDGKKTLIRVPVSGKESFVAALAKVPPSERITFQRHKVQKGETLGVIAKKYGVGVSDIQRLNSVKNANRIYVGMELVIPAKGAQMPPAAKGSLASATGSGSKKTRTRKVSHTVRKGESLSTIAGKYNVKQSDLMRWNGIKNANRIYAGQALKVYEPASNWSTYTVRKGDNLTAIAKRHGCSVSDLKSWNKLGGSKIYPGQKLRVRSH